MEMATLAGGCFWCVEAVLEQQEGVKSVVSGYAGGHDKSPTYEQVCSGTSGHAEVVQVTFDPKVVSYESLLEIFWRAHDPTTMNRQGNDVGSQYRSAIYYHNEQQREAALKSLKEAQAQFKDKIVTEVVELDTFYAAEKYHQDFYQNNPGQGYCTYVIQPKLKKMGLNY
ncbi:MAG: peptide-methionine (S)-S-oxide reductase MsrA [Verrucomicrobia bacterium]|nr:peptide-methionine (S)-S-oxide reductase MsrA [Verrucomicrobiota bacterium]